MWHGRELRVLVVDDDDDMRWMTSLSLAESVSAWCTVLEASSGCHALKLAESEHPDVILMDATMPELDGLETLALLRSNARTRAIPVIFVTARVLRRDCESYLAAGAIGVIAKPYQPELLAGEIFRILGRPEPTSIAEGLDS